MIFNNGKLEWIGACHNICGATDEQIENEAQFFQASPKFVCENKDKAPLAYSALRLLGDHLGTQSLEYTRLRIDTKVHMLKPGWYPCIPDWHCDFVQRDDNGTLIPDPEKDAETRHFIMVSGTPATQFIRQRKIKLDIETASWEDVNRELEKHVTRARYTVFQLQPGGMYEMDAQELHRGLASENACWRWFFRASLFPHGVKRINKIRTQQQVYIPLGLGW